MLYLYYISKGFDQGQKVYITQYIYYIITYIYINIKYIICIMLNVFVYNVCILYIYGNKNKGEKLESAGNSYVYIDFI